MTELTSPDNIAKWTLQDPTSIVQESQTQGDSIQAALDKRQRYDYVWADSAARTAQTGMVQGSRGYQVDTKSEYLYDSSAWRLAVPYAEYTKGVQAINSGVYTQLGGWTQVAASTTDTTFTSISATGGILTIVNPGVYSVSVVSGYAGSSPAGSFTTITPDLAHLSWYDIGGYIQSIGTTGSFIRTTASNQTVYLWTFQASGGAVNITFGTLRVIRLG
jgi:hypothetical protein